MVHRFVVHLTMVYVVASVLSLAVDVLLHVLMLIMVRLTWLMRMRGISGLCFYVIVAHRRLHFHWFVSGIRELCDNFVISPKLR